MEKPPSPLKKTDLHSLVPQERSCEKFLGDYQGFFSDLLHRLDQVGIPIRGLPIVQLLYRVETNEEYERIRDGLKPLCKEFVETLFNGRAVSILILREALVLEGGFTVSVIELPAPRQAHMYPSGLESVGILLGDKLPAFITFDNGKTVKFYDRTLEEIVLLQGWRFERIKRGRA